MHSAFVASLLPPEEWRRGHRRPCPVGTAQSLLLTWGRFCHILRMGLYSCCMWWQGSFFQEEPRSFNWEICISSTLPVFVRRDAVLSCEHFSPVLRHRQPRGSEPHLLVLHLRYSALWRDKTCHRRSTTSVSSTQLACSPFVLRNSMGSWIQPLVTISTLGRDAGNLLPWKFTLSGPWAPISYCIMWAWKPSSIPSPHFICMVLNSRVCYF